MRYRILKQMVMKYLDPKADLTFKKIFGNHPDRLKNLLNTFQSLNEDELIQQQHVPTRPERAEAPSPGQRPGYYDIQTNAL